MTALAIIALGCALTWLGLTIYDAVCDSRERRREMPKSPFGENL